MALSCTLPPLFKQSVFCLSLSIPDNMSRSKKCSKGEESLDAESLEKVSRDFCDYLTVN